MVLSKMNSIKKESGFTIVELLIVIVVIGILAAITIVAYSGITGRANTTKAQSNAASAQKVAEAYNADAGYYPPTVAAFGTGYGASPSSKLPSGMSVIAGLPGTAGAFTGTEPTNAGNGLTTVSYGCLTSCTNSTGGRITYWDFTTGARSTTIVYVGSGSSTGTYVAAP